MLNGLVCCSFYSELINQLMFAILCTYSHREIGNINGDGSTMEIKFISFTDCKNNIYEYINNNIKPISEKPVRKLIKFCLNKAQNRTKKLERKRTKRA